jgi:hypothetical protein
MKSSRDINFSDRLNTGAKAKAEQLARAKARLKANAETADERHQARQKLVAEREARIAARGAAKRAEAERLETERRAEEEARLAAEREAAEALARKKEEERAKLAQILIDQKAARDARYAARKARSR